MTNNTVYYYPNVATLPASYCKLFKVTSYDYETGEFVIAGGLERSILNTDKYADLYELCYKLLERLND